MSGGERQEDWWRNAVIYEIYPRSFRDSNGDGVGDIPGMTMQLPYLRELGVDAVWVTPWYASPMVDGGYDVSDFTAIAEAFGTLEDAVTFIDEAHRHSLRVIIDLVPNHTSTRHPWFQQALGAAPGAPERDRYWFRPGRGMEGELPPNNWRSVFGGPAWSRVTDAGGTDDEWYLHLFAPEQPDLNWTNDNVRSEFDEILRFWFDTGVDGFRIDVAHGITKNPELPDIESSAGRHESALDPLEVSGAAITARHPHWDRDESHGIFQRWRAIADSYPPAGQRIFVAEAWRLRPNGLSRYLVSDELHTAFNLDFLGLSWSVDDIRRRITDHLALVEMVGAPATWVLGSHDVPRVVTRLGHESHWAHRGLDPSGTGTDLQQGLRRARAAALLILALPGSCYIYQGDELGLPEVEDLPDDRLQDPMWTRTGHAVRGRDGCRVPLPWRPDAPGFGFTTGEPWLPIPASWASLSVSEQRAAPDSTLSLYRTAIQLRKQHLDATGAELRWTGIDTTPGAPDAPDVLIFERGTRFRCVLNLSSTAAIAIPSDYTPILSSVPLEDGLIAPDTSVWLTKE
ncbi:glycoside hydrolase family 13 protein [Agromyces silvae]|uniref:glycoside hydrolase family 13 protein n=1 Tax=Agromyces silvae TaxID=3388266 RepID=UPI00280AA8C3|nr:glycoside hydrolase family 13 protein [Agromyces protaetiae]